MSSFTESIIEQAAIDWLKELGCDFAIDPGITFDIAVHIVARLHDSLLPKLIGGVVRVSEL